jgi:hypothetical protein
MDAEWLTILFTHHPLTDAQAGRADAIREKAVEFGLTILAATQPSADQTAAIRKLRECVMTANAAIALEGRS